MNQVRHKTQVLIIGSGIGGSTAALVLAEAGVQVALLSAADDVEDTNTALAQGGIIYKSGEDDAPLLMDDILKAGWEYNYRPAVDFISSKGPDAVQEILIEHLKIPFMRQQDNTWDMTKEGGHSRKRILHCADFTGRAIMEGLGQAVKKHPNIQILTRRTAIDLLTTHHNAQLLQYKYSLNKQCLGAYVFNEATKEVETWLAEYTILATGGCGQLYLHSTNKQDSVGSALAMASRAGARTMNAEFIQFHPTALYHNDKRRFLISEAVRGEGAKLINSQGELFMPRYDERADLAPRDIVARAIWNEMLVAGEPHVYLDAANHVPKDLKQRFPTIYERCLEIGIDITTSPIPVVPAAHYACGGVLTGITGKTSLGRLYAVGECACTGVHGANRLASTSLLEGLLWGREAGHQIAHRVGRKTLLRKVVVDSIPDWKYCGNKDSEDPVLISQDWERIRHTMWNYVGITRTSRRLKRAKDEMHDLNKHLTDFYQSTPISKSLIDLFHGVQASAVITWAAERNLRSRGCHFRKKQ